MAVGNCARADLLAYVVVVKLYDSFFSTYWFMTKSVSRLSGASLFIGIVSVWTSFVTKVFLTLEEVIVADILRFFDGVTVLR